MPFTIQQINEFVPKIGRDKVDTDPAFNSVLANIQLLNRELDAIKTKYPKAKILQTHLDNVLKAANGETDEELGDKTINGLGEEFKDFNRFTLGDGLTSLPSDEQKNKIKNLLGYVAAGLGIEPAAPGDFEVTDEQRDDAKYVRDQGRTDVAEEKVTNPELHEAKVKEPPRNAYEALEEFKSQAKKLPKLSRIPARAEAQKKEAADLCTKIMASRRAISAKRNNKAGLQNATLYWDIKQNRMSKLENSETFQNFLKDTPYSELAKLAGEGHGGALEDKFRDYVNRLDKLPTDVDPYYYPDAKTRTETIKDKLKANNLTPQEKEDLYVELLAARAAVDSMRGDKSTLSKAIDPKKFEQIRQSYQKEPIKTVFQNAIGREMGEKALTAAKSGHGGALEDLMAEEVREMAKTSAEGYHLRSLPPRLMPTRQERMKDIQEMLLSGRLNAQQKYEHILEYNALANTKGPGPKDKIKDPELSAIQMAAGETAKLYRRVDDPRFLRRLEKACLGGGDALKNELESAAIAHKGDLKAAQMQEDLAQKADLAKGKKELAVLAAQKMMIGQALYESRSKEDLQDAEMHRAGQRLLDAQLNTIDISKLGKRPEFKAMIESMTEEELRAGIKSNNFDIVKKFNETVNIMKAQKEHQAQSLHQPEKEAENIIEMGDPQGKGIVPQQ